LYFGPMKAHRTIRFILLILSTFAQGAFAQSKVAKPKKPALPAKPRLMLEPRQPKPASLIRVTIDGLGRNDDSVVTVVGHMADEPLRFLPASEGRFQALAAIPLGASDSVVALAVITRASGAADTLHLALKYPHRPAPPATTVGSRGRAPGARRLKVDPRFTRRLDTETETRVERESQLAREVGKRAQDSPPLWTYPFLRPRESKVTSRFGTGRVFNGRVSSSHLGVDYRGSLGEPIVAANRGVVALVAEFFLAGNVVYIDHGGGLVTGYFHMSEPLVAAGDTVERGQEIGRVGATGRVTGPHLHWSARFGAVTVDPAGLLAIGAPFAQPDTASKRAGAIAGPQR
jgi:murein DD-endopeptidase MepM/ murein hydrolase activator NlpD